MNALLSPPLPQVVNRHHFKGKSKPEGWLNIGRPHPLGNPYPLTQFSREDSLNLYRSHLGEIIDKRHGKEWDALLQLVEKHKRGEPITLVCSCKPKDCHGDILVEVIQRLVQEFQQERSTLDKVDKQEEASADTAEYKVPDVPQLVLNAVPPCPPLNMVVYHVDTSRVKDRRDNKSPRRGKIVANNDTNPWLCVPGMVEVQWDDRLRAISVKHPYKDQEYTLAAEPDRVPVRMLGTEVGQEFWHT